MRFFLTGATGFIGRAFTLRLRRDGHQVRAWVRDPQRGRALLGDEAEVLRADPAPHALARALAGCDGVVNLAGEPILPARWTEARKQALVASRVGVTQALVTAMGKLDVPPPVLVSASAVGFYGSRGDLLCPEGTSAGDGFLARLCQAWEQAAALADSHGVRVVSPRIGLVLGHEGGLLAETLPLFDLGLGVSAGPRGAWMPWIHLHDMVEILVAALMDERLEGPVNAVAPSPVTALTFWASLAAQLRTKLDLRLPQWAVRLRFGEADEALSGSTRAVPARLEAAGFAFAHPSLKEALADLLVPAGRLRIGRLRDTLVRPLLATDHVYLKDRPPTYLLQADTALAQPLPGVFDFFCRAENLGLMTPKTMGMRIKGPPPTIMQPDLRISYGLSVAGVGLGWRTVIAHWDPPYAFVDAQERGPYRSWWHEHHFRSDDGGARMEDRVFYAPPLGPLGVVAHGVGIRRQLERIFLYRHSAITLRFGAGVAAAPPVPAAADAESR